MIVLFTDFGREGPYTGQMQAVLQRCAPGVPVIDLLADVPAYDIRAAAYLLPALAAAFEAGTVFLCVVDPGVGGHRAPVALRADGSWYVGPDNGLFALVQRRAAAADSWEISWRPDRLSASFHGRDLFAPVAARLARGEAPPGQPRPAATLARPDWPDDLAAVIYVDAFGNAMTGLRAATLPAGARLSLAATELPAARTFSDQPPGTAFWYENANGLVEIAVNQGSAAARFALAPGTPVALS